MASLGFHSGTLLTFTWPPWLSLATEEDSKTLFLYIWLYCQNCIAEATKVFSLLGPLVQVHFHQLSLFNGFFHCLSLLSWNSLCRLFGLNLRDHRPLPSECLGLKACVVMLAPKLLKFLFIANWKLSWVGSCHEFPIPFSPFRITLFFNLFIFLSTILTSITLPGVPFLLKPTFCTFPCSVCSFSFYICIRLATNNHETVNTRLF